MTAAIINFIAPASFFILQNDGCGTINYRHPRQFGGMTHVGVLFEN
jgi:deoxyinosine 3'endonuclease (endonuclease V)